MDTTNLNTQADLNYLDLGYNKFLTKNKQSEKDVQEWTEDEASLKVSQLSGSTIAFGESYSPDKKMIINWEKRKVTIGDGARTRVVLGWIEEENKYGIRVIDATGVTQLDETY